MEVKGKRLRAMFDSYKRDPRIENPAEYLHDQVQESLDSGEIKPEDFSLRDLFTNLVPSGWEMLHDWDRSRRRGGHIVMEAVHAVDSATFASITGQLVFSAVQDSMALDEGISDQLVTVFPSQFQNAELVPGITAVSDEFADEVAEGDPYPIIGLAAEDITLPRAEKHGGILPITREAIIADRTGVLIERAQTVGRAAGLRKEKDILRVVIGGVNPYIRKGEARNTYASTGMGFDNDGTPNLVNYTDIQEQDELFHAIREPNTNEPLGFRPTTIVCSPQLAWTARHVVRDTQVRLGLIDTAPGIQSIGANRIPYNLDILSNEFLVDAIMDTAANGGLAVAARADANLYWWLGNPRAAFVWKEIWGLTTEEAPVNNEAQFSQDVWFRVKVSYKGCPGVREPRVMVRSDGTA